MRFLLDTNVVSEWSRPMPDETVVDWIYSQRPADLAISVLTYNESLFGILADVPGRRRSALEAWFSDVLLDMIGDRIVAIDPTIARRWAELRVEARLRGRKIPTFDAGILATAAVRGLTVVTRDHHFPGFGVSVLDPWPAPS